MKISDYHTQALIYIDQVKEFLEENGLNFLVFQQLMEDFRNNKISTKVLAEKAKELFKGNNDLLVGFNAFLPEDSKIEVDELDASEEVNGCVHGAVEFLNKAKLFLKGNDSVYQALLNAFNGNNKDVDDVYKEVAVILVGHQDLMEEFNKFVLSSEEGKKDSIKKKRKTSPDHDEMDCKDCVNKVCRKVLSRKDRRKTNPDCDGADSKDCMNKVYRQGLAFFKKIKSCFGNSGEYLKFLEQIHEYNSKRIEIGGVVQWVAKFPHLVAEFEKFLNDCSNLSRIKEDKSVNVGHKRQKIEVVKTKNKERFKCIEGKDFSNCETCTPSYWSMPEEYGVPKSNLQRSDLDGDVLNNQWVCRNSRQGNFKTRKLSKYEEVLNKCEDNRYEADMMLHLLRSTAERIDILLNGENKLDFETLEIPFKIEEYLSVLYARCVERLYGGYELEALNYNPKIGLPILLDRLKQKIKECEKDLIELTKLHLGCSRPSSLTQNPLPKLVPQSFKNIE